MKSNLETRPTIALHGVAVSSEFLKYKEELLCKVGIDNILDSCMTVDQIQPSEALA